MSPTIWLAFESENDLKFAPFKQRCTVGSANSNMIPLEGKGIRPLQGQFFVEENQYFYRDFFDRSIRALQLGSSIQVGLWRAHLNSLEELHEKYRSTLLESFKQILKSQSQQESSTALQQLRRKFFLSEDLPQPIEQMLVSQYNELSLLGPIEYLLSLPDVTDILVEKFDRIWVEEAGELKLSPLQFTSEETYWVYIENLLVETHKSIDEASPFVDFVLKDGSRGHLIGPPVTPGNRYLSIRKTKENFLTLKHLAAREMFDDSTLALLQSFVEMRFNLLVSGSTGSGKTTLIRALLNECPSSQRILIIEDTPELKLPRENSIFLCTRLDAKGNQPPIHLRDLVRQSLRMRPDRITIGEVRGAEALDLLHAMNTGHRGCFGTLHSNSSRDALFRLQGLVQMSDASLSEEVTRDLIARNIQVVVHCDRKKSGQRFIREIARIRGIDQGRILLEVNEFE